MFSIWTKGIEESLKRTPGGAARLTSLRFCVSFSAASLILTAGILAECNPIFQGLQHIPRS